jgi:hypothetical protein
MSKEKWVFVKGYEKMYKVSDLGNVMSFKSGNWKLMKPTKDTSGYRHIHLCRNGEAKQYLLHRLVAIYFLPNRKHLPEVNHKKGIKADNRASQLEWVTISQNKIHAYRILGVKSNGGCHGKYGALHHNSKAVRQVDKISGIVIKKYGGILEAARLLGLSRQSIALAACGKQNSYAGYKWEFV